MDKITKQNALNAHTWVGVFLSVLLFLVCLSGTVAVFHLEFERWEQPHIEEMKNVSPDVVMGALCIYVHIDSKALISIQGAIRCFISPAFVAGHVFPENTATRFSPCNR